MSNTFFEKPILNSPYEEPKLHHALDDEGQPTDLPPQDGRRTSALISPVPKPKKKKSRVAENQQDLALHSQDGISTEEQEYNPTPLINDVRKQVKQWRELSNPQNWSVTPTTARLLQHWRQHDFQDIRPFFC
ncbi:MAG: hypothetical protein L3J04_02560 [Robiginitomaculum sp.]|nr:hypothetical protein [Robiginitomaculum sp.]